MKNLLMLCAALAAMSLFSCGGGKNSNFERLTAKEWMLDNIEYPAREAIEGVPPGVFVQFTDSMTLYGRGGCNNFFGQVQTMAYNQISIVTGGSTMMYCPYQDFENRFMDLIERCTTYEADENNLRLYPSDESFILNFTPKLDDSWRNVPYPTDQRLFGDESEYDVIPDPTKDNLLIEEEIDRELYNP